MSHFSTGSFLVTATLTLGLVFLASSEILNGRPASSQPAPSTAEERGKAFNWFGTLGFPDVKGLKFVRVATGLWYSAGNAPPRNTFVRGFLLKENGEEFTVLTLSVATETYHKTRANKPAYEEVGYEAADLSAGAAAILKNLRSPPGPDEQDARPLWDTSLANRTETFVLAWACWRNGLEKLSAELFDQASNMPGGPGDDSDKQPAQTLQQQVAADLAHAEMWRAVVAFGDPAIPRTELLKRFERIVKNYPESKHQERARDTVAILQRMVKEDREHAQKDRQPLEQLDKKEQIAEWIFQLRDQNGHQFSQPGSCDIFDPISVKQDSPAHQLVKMGYDAVPQLIESMEDQRFTRSVGFHRNFYFSHYVLRVGDCALTILERITGRSFWQASSTLSHLSKEQEAAETKKKAQAWYAEFKQKGEKRMLIEAVERGDRDSPNQATLLLERYPDEALTALKAGIKAARNSSSRDLLVASLTHIKGDGPLPVLLVEVKEGPYWYGRLVSAMNLQERGRAEGVAGMIAEWQGQRPSQQPEPGVKRDEVEEPGAGLTGVAQFLATCGEIKAIAALEKDLRQRPVGLRLSVVSSFGKSGNLSTIATTGGGSIQPGGRPVRDNPREVRDAIEQLLFRALDDTEERTGLSGSWNGKNFTDPRICDVASHVLNELAPDLYSFDLGAPLAKRNLAIVDLKNNWRKSHGLSILPVLVHKAIAPVGDERLQPLVEKLLHSPAAEREKAMAGIEALGLGALPGVQNRLARATRIEASERATLEKLVRRISCIIDDATLSEDSLRPAAVVNKLKSMKGKPFEADSFMELIRSLVKNLPRGVQALRFSVDKTGDGSGLTLKVDLLDERRAKQLGRSGSFSPGPAAPKGIPIGWDFNERVEVGEKELHALSGSSRHAYWLEDKHTVLVDALNAACSSAPTEPFVVRILLIADLGK